MRDTYESGDFAVFGGSTCVGSNGLPPVVSAAGNTTPGASFSIHLDQAAPFRPSLFAFGVSDAAWAGVPLPLSLAVVNADPACELASSAEQVFVHLTDLAGSAVRFFQVPADPSLVGLTRYAAWVVLDAAAPGNPAGYVSSNSVAMTVN